MLKLTIGNRTYSSWSMRGWLLVKLSGLAFEAEVLPLDTPEFAAAAADPARLPSGKVPTLWDEGVAVWDSMAILMHLEERCGRERFWPADLAARAHARSAVAEMHSGFTALRKNCSMHLRRRVPDHVPAPDTLADLGRIEQIWIEARTGHGRGGPFLYGAFSAADAFYAPVVTRTVTYGLPLSATASAYAEAVLAHAWLGEWQAGADAEAWTVDRFEP